MADSPEEPEELVQGRIRWKRFGIMLVPAVLAVGFIVLGMANGAIAASFSVSGQSFKISADNLHGTGFKQFSGVDVTSKGTNIPVATSVINSASVTRATAMPRGVRSIRRS